MSRSKLTEREDDNRGVDRCTSDRDLSEFLLRACHDLRSSLRAVRTHAELLQRDGQATNSVDFETRLAFIIDGVRRIHQLTDSLAGYSIALRVDDASFRSARMDVMLRTALARLDAELREQGAEVTCGELPRVSGDPDQLVQIFEILLRNALRHRAELPPRVHITAEKRGDEWLLAVRDNGPGIEADYLDRVFKPFERLNSTKAEGTGMGLAICRAIIERHGGKLWAESEPGIGSTFFFSLPVVD